VSDALDGGRGAQENVRQRKLILNNSAGEGWIEAAAAEKGKDFTLDEFDSNRHPRIAAAATRESLIKYLQAACFFSDNNWNPLRSSV
jgi:hypothetical protein